MGLDLDRILQLAQEMDDAPELSAEQAEQLSRLFVPVTTARRSA